MAYPRNYFAVGAGRNHSVKISDLAVMEKDVEKMTMPESDDAPVASKIVVVFLAHYIQPGSETYEDKIQIQHWPHNHQVKEAFYPFFHSLASVSRSFSAGFVSLF